MGFGSRGLAAGTSIAAAHDWSATGMQTGSSDLSSMQSLQAGMVR